MKEYICKNDVLKLASVSESEDEWIIDIHDMDQLPIVTKTDIFKDVKREIKRMKTEVNSTNSDYNTGYISALSTLEGFLSEMEQENE